MNVTMMPRSIHNFALALPVLITRVYFIHKEMMHQHITCDFKVVCFASVIHFEEAIIYAYVVYGQDWACTIYIL